MVILVMFDSLQIGERGGLYIIKYGYMYMNVFFFVDINMKVIEILLIWNLILFNK